MFDSFICGCGSFRPEEEDDELSCRRSSSPESTPPTTKRSNCSSNNNNVDAKNPYATRGLDKYSALLADLDQRRQKIYAQLGSDDNNSLVRFVFPEPDSCRPVIVRLREKPITETNNSNKNDNSPLMRSDLKQSGNIPAAAAKSNRRAVSLERLRWSSYYMPVVIIAILLMLTVVGRSVAILCTSIAWYLVPTLHSGRSGSKKQTKKKELARNNSMNVIKGGTRTSSPLNRWNRRF